MATTPLPSATPQQPPNFYQQAAQGATAPKPASDDTKDFSANIAKLLGIIGKMAKMKPKGKDISKPMQAAALAIQKAQEMVDGDANGDSSGTDTDAQGDAEKQGATGATA